ncbi:MAG: DUF4142 domain-containing protein, partial [Verrucomicrobiota bacterium]|nr:DUF4142 domain-containing protein [Verrucomicrobiota bacterium]
MANGTTVALKCGRERISMITRTLSVFAAGMIAVISFPVDAAGQQPAATADRAAVHKIIDTWPNRPKLGAQQMLAKYGAPQEVTSEKLVWHNQGPYKRINVTRMEHHHDFPKPHMDYMEHTIAYRVPVDKADALTAYDGSLTFDRTRGEMSARCDLEGHNILTLNLANDIVMGKKSAEEARKAFGQNVVDDALGKYPPYTTALQFEPKMDDVMFADKPVIPGSPERPMGDPQSRSRSKEGSGDGEVLGFLAAVNDNEIVAALEAGKKKLNSEVADYAKMLHKEHGKNLDDTLKLGQRINVTPMETAAVDKLRVKGAGELAALAPLDGEKFASAY